MPNPTTPTSQVADRRSAILDSALATFARFGYRKTSMDEVARVAEVSRPGLYFLFDSKEALFRAAATHSLEVDLAAAEEVLGSADGTFPDRLVKAFDHWAGRYVGPGARDIAAVVESNPGLLGDIVEDAPRRFEQLVLAGLDRAGVTSTVAVRTARALISVSVGLKHQVDDRTEYLARFREAVDLLVS